MTNLKNKTKAELISLVNELQNKLDRSINESNDELKEGISHSSIKSKLNILIEFINNVFELNNFSDVANLLFKYLKKFKRAGNWGVKLAIYDKSIDEYCIAFPDNKPGSNTPVIMRCKLNDVGYFSKIAIDTKKVLFIEDNHSEESLKIDIRQGALPRGSLIFIPLFYKDNLVGLFSYSSSPEKSIDYNFKLFLEAISKILSVVLAMLLWVDINKTEFDLSEISNEKNYKRIVDSITDYHYKVIISNGKAIKTIHNTSSVDVTGYSPDEFNRDEFLWFKMIYDEDREKVQKFIDKIFTEKVAESIEHRIITKQGELRWVRNTIVPEKSESGELISYDGLLKDITKTKLIEEQIRKSEEKLSKIFDQSLDLLFIVSKKEGIILDINRTACNFFGVQKNEILGKSIIDIGLFDIGIFRKLELEVERTGRYKIISHKFKINEETYDFDINAEIIELFGENNIFITAEDRTKQRKMQYELERIHNLESIGILAGGIAHDFNNILTAILGNISFVKMNIPQTDRMYKFLSRAEDSCFKAKELSNKLLTFSKGGKPQIEITSIENIIREYSFLTLSGSNIFLNFQVLNSIYKVAIDPDQIRQVVISIVENAKEAMPLGGELIIRIENCTVFEKSDLHIPPGKYVKISFIDHGVGIPPENLQKIFDPYFSTKVRGNEKGMGLGLSISYSIISKHNGYITVSSKVGQGTTFTIYLPAASD